MAFPNYYYYFGWIKLEVNWNENKRQWRGFAHTGKCWCCVPESPHKDLSPLPSFRSPPIISPPFLPSIIRHIPIPSPRLTSPIYEGEFWGIMNTRSTVNNNYYYLERWIGIIWGEEKLIFILKKKVFVQFCQFSSKLPYPFWSFITNCQLAYFSFALFPFSSRPMPCPPISHNVHLHSLLFPCVWA